MKRHVTHEVICASCCPWCGCDGVPDSFAMHPRSNQTYCFACRSESTIGESLEEEMGADGLPRTLRDVDTSDILTLLRNTGHGGLLDAGKRIPEGRLLIRCPVHEEKTPSCIVWPKQNRFACLSCGAEGSTNALRAYLLIATFDRNMRNCLDEGPTVSTDRSPH